MTPITATAQQPSSRSSWSTPRNQPDPTKLSSTVNSAAPPTPYAFQSTVSRSSTAPRSSRHQMAAITASATTRAATDTHEFPLLRPQGAQPRRSRSGSAHRRWSRAAAAGPGTRSTARARCRPGRPTRGPRPPRRAPNRPGRGCSRRAEAPVVTASMATTRVDRPATRSQPTVSQAQSPDERAEAEHPDRCRPRAPTPRAEAQHAEQSDHNRQGSYGDDHQRPSPPSRARTIASDRPGHRQLGEDRGDVVAHRLRSQDESAGDRGVARARAAIRSRISRSRAVSSGKAAARLARRGRSSRGHAGPPRDRRWPGRPRPPAGHRRSPAARRP